MTGREGFPFYSLSMNSFAVNIKILANIASFEKVRKFKVEALFSSESKLSVYPAKYAVVADSLKTSVPRLPL